MNIYTYIYRSIIIELELCSSLHHGNKKRKFILLCRVIFICTNKINKCPPLSLDEIAIDLLY